jgi:alpha-galactosidase
VVYRTGVAVSGREVLCASGLPPGIHFDVASGALLGRTEVRGEHPITISGEDADGRWTETVVLVVGDEICLTPPMGWNSWNAFGPAVTEADVRGAATVLLGTGLADLGWTYVNIDDGWQGERDRRGRLHPNDRFSDMAELCADLHAVGLNVGIYSSPGPTTCAGLVGSLGHEYEDAARFATWGFDYLKYDWCSAGPHTGNLPVDDLVAPFARMRAALDHADRDLVYHICEYGWGDVWTWAASRAGANAWRTTGDIEDSWESVDRIGFGQAGLERYAGPGRWNDPDMLVVGSVGGAWSKPVRSTPLNPDEQRSHLGLWVLLSGPLLLGCDLGALDPWLAAMVGNAEIVAVHQDRLGRQAHRVHARGPLEIWRKDLADGSSAVGIFNRGEVHLVAGIDWRDIGLGAPAFIRDLWERRDVNLDVGWQASLPPHGSALLLVSPPSPALE